MNLTNKDRLFEAIEKTDRLLPAARTLGRALHLLQDAKSTLLDIAQLINCDSALAVDVLRCANSAYYSRASRVSSIGEAMHVIGFDETKRFVCLAVAQKATNRELKAYGISAEDYWVESLFNGYFLEDLIRRIGDADPAEAYIVGLLRFVGRLVIDSVIVGSPDLSEWDGNTVLSEWEQSQVGLTHSNVGGKMLRKWSFPPRLCNAIESQNSTDEIQHASSRLADCMRFVSEILPEGRSFTLIDPKAGGVIPCEEDHPFLITHKLKIDTVAAVYQTAKNSCASIREMMRGATGALRGGTGDVRDKGPRETRDWDF
ncbi:MAG: HDOD domain-containing protein [Verrucomicrobiota bacterium]